MIIPSPDGHTRLSRALARPLPEPVPAHRQDSIVADVGAGSAAAPDRLGAAAIIL
jgi:hypothetical protein